MHQIHSKNHNIGKTKNKSIKKNQVEFQNTFFRKIPVKKNGRKTQYRHKIGKIHNAGKYGREG